MTAYVVVYVKIKDAEKLAEYSSAVGPVVAAHGGEFVMRAPVLEVLTGQADYDRFALIKFPDADAARTWYQSEDYQAHIPTRDAGAEMLFTLVDG